MNNKHRKYLLDIEYSLQLIEEFLSDISSYQQYAEDRKTQSAVERQLGIIGEATKKLASQTRPLVLENSKKIVSLRNRLVHAYDV